MSIPARVACLVMIAALGLFLQAWAADPLIGLTGSDAPKYLSVARNAPAHVLYDGRFFMMHPPLHPWLIRLVALSGCSLTAAGIFVSSLCTAALGVVICLLARRLLDSWAAGVFAALLFLCSGAATFLGQGVWREPVQTLILYSVFLLALGKRDPRAEGDSPAPGKGRRLAAVLLGAAGGLTWDPFVFAAPVLLVFGRLQRRPLLAWAGIGLIVAWTGWASVRYAALKADPTSPAGMDGMVEPAAADPGFSPAVFFSPNRLPWTAEWDRYHWPIKASPQRVFQILAPRVLHGPEDVLRPDPPPAVNWGATGVFLLVLVGGVLLARAPPERWRDLLPIAVVAVGLGLPSLAGRQGRYGYPLLPLLCIVAGACGRALWPRLEPRRAADALALAGLALIVAWGVQRPPLTWTRPTVAEARSAVAALSASGVEPRSVAGVRGMTPTLCWLFPNARVVTLPLDGDLVAALLEDRKIEVIILPHEVQVYRRPGSDPDAVDFIYGLHGIRGVYDLVGRGELVHLGVTVEAQRRPGHEVGAYDVFWRPAAGPPPAPFRFHVDPFSLVPLREAIDEGHMTEPVLRLLRAHRAELTGDGAAGLLEALER